MDATLEPSLPDEPREFGFYMGGRFVAAGSRGLAERVSPAHGVAATRVPACTADDVESAVGLARKAFADGVWSRLSGAERAQVLLGAAAGVRDRLEELAYWETLETGKPISQSRSEVQASAGYYEYAAGVARTLSGDSFNNLGEGMFGLVVREPIGVVGLITPWNFPFLILAERLPFMLAAGCTVVAKPSEFTSATTLMMAEILTGAGLPDNVFNVVTGFGLPVGQAITAHEDIDMVSFTGSVATGRRALAASATNIKKLGLELGGKSPQIVYADADLEAAADGVVYGVCLNAGQCCVSGSRVVVEASAAEAFQELLVQKFARVRVGDPLDPRTQMGAIVTEAHCQKILGYIRSGVEAGARIACGGGTLESRGWFIEPTLLVDVRNDMAVAQEEIFGPVLTMTTFETPEETASSGSPRASGPGTSTRRCGPCAASGRGGPGSTPPSRAGPNCPSADSSTRETAGKPASTASRNTRSSNPYTLRWARARHGCPRGANEPRQGEQDNARPGWAHPRRAPG